LSEIMLYVCAEHKSSLPFDQGALFISIYLHWETVMHACLQVPELLSEIMLYVCAEHKSSLPFVAVACKALKEPALEALYDTIGFDKLLLCLGSDAISLKPDSAYQVIELKRQMTHCNWNVLLSYSARVRHLIYPSDELHLSKHTIIKPNVYENLQSRACQYLFPMLLRLTLRSTPSIDEYRSFLDSPSLRKLTLGMSEPGDIKPLVNAIASDSSNISELSCICGHVLEEDALHEAVSRWPRLHTLWMIPLHHKMLSLLPLLCNLRSLTLSIQPLDSWIRDRTRLEIRSLDKLMIIASGGPSLCADVLPLIFGSGPCDTCLTSLRRLDLIVHGPHEGRSLPEALAALFKAPSQSPSSKSLKTFRLFIEPGQPTHASSLASDWEGLVALMEAFENIKEFKISFNRSSPSPECRLGISKEQLFRILRRWSSVQAVTLRIVRPLSLDALVEALGICPQLQRFNVNVLADSNGVSAISQTVDAEYASNRVSRLCLLWDDAFNQDNSIPIFEVSRVALVLHKITPYVRFVMFSDDTKGGRETEMMSNHPA